MCKYKGNTEIEFTSVYFNSTAQTVIGFEDSLDKSFQEIFNRLDNSKSEVSGWVID